MAKRDVQQGTLALMVLKTLEVLGPLHGYGIARRIEQISGDLLAVNQGTLYPVLLRLEHEGAIASAWGTSENNRRARFYQLTAAGRRRLRAETREWAETTALMDRFMAVKAEDPAPIRPTPDHLAARAKRRAQGRGRAVRAPGAADRGIPQLRPAAGRGAASSQGQARRARRDLGGLP
jgi:transcriptional regulator